MCRGRYNFWWPVGFLLTLMMIFWGFKLLMFIWPVFFILPCVFWFSRNKHRWYHGYYHHWQDNDDDEWDWEKPKRKNDEMSEKPKRDGQSEIYYF